jgi:hypothetical protein
MMIMAICAIVLCWIPLLNIFFLFWVVGGMFYGDIRWSDWWHDRVTTILGFVAIAVNVIFWGIVLHWFG